MISNFRFALKNHIVFTSPNEMEKIMLPPKINRRKSPNDAVLGCVHGHLLPSIGRKPQLPGPLPSFSWISAGSFPQPEEPQ